MSESNLFMSRSDRGKSIKKKKINKERIYTNFQSHLMEMEDSESEDDSVYEERKRASTISTCNITLRTFKTLKKKRKKTQNILKPSKIDKISFLDQNTAKYEKFEKEIIFKQTFEKLKKMKIDKILLNHEVDERLRAKMMDWMIEVIKIYNQKESTIYKSFFLLDLYLKKEKNKIKINQIHLIGGVCLFIASKFEEVVYLNINTLFEKILYKKFSKKNIIDKELEILSVINFRSNLPNIYEISRCGFNFINFENKEIEIFFRNSSLLISKLCLFSIEITEFFNYNQISAISMILVLKIINKLKKNYNTDKFVS